MYLVMPVWIQMHFHLNHNRDSKCQGLVSKQHLVIGPSLALLQGSGILCHLMSDAPNLLMFLK